MSRHKLVKGMNLDDELDDYDGGADYGYGEEDETGTGDYPLSAEDKEQMEIGTATVRSVLGPEIQVSDKDIQDSLWNYYYDVDQTVAHILDQQYKTRPAKSKKVAEGTTKKAKETSAHPDPLVQPHKMRPKSSSAKEFFQDMPWLNIPEHRRAAIVIEPLYPRGGLLGGASNQSAPKMSKLAALAAARKRKETEKAASEDSKSVNNSVALLDKLRIKDVNAQDEQLETKTTDHPDSRKKCKVEGIETPTQTQSLPKANRKYPKKTQKPPTPPPPPEPEDDKMSDNKPTEEPPPLAAPSAFASALFGPLTGASNPVANATPFLAARFGPNYGSDVQSANFNPFAGPSPDDIVASAQASSKGTKGSKSKHKASTSNDAVNGVTETLANTVVNDAPKTKSKNLDVVAEYGKLKRKNAANFVVIGHVDAGKSTLMGRLLYDLGVVDQRTIDRYRKEAETIGKSSFALAWVLDQGTEERSRGVTIDIAMNKFETEKTSFTILDAPGHRDFIPNMIAGASQADFAVLVIDASTGSFESGLKGQTKEHALLVRSMGVRRLIVAINKLDTVAWSEARFEEIKQQISALLSIAGFQSRNITFIPCSGLTGANIVSRATDPDAAWYTGPIMIEELDNSEPTTFTLEKPLRLTITDIFRGGVQNPLSVSGRIDAGSVQVGDTVLAVPSGETANIKGIEVDSESAEWAVAGQNVTLHLSDIDPMHLKAGDVICPPSAPLKCLKEFTVKILAFEHMTPMHVEIHRGRLHASGRVTQLVAVLDKGSGAIVKKKPRLIKPGDVARVVVEVDVEGGVPLEAPGRVILRAGGQTVAAGLLE